MTIGSGLAIAAIWCAGGAIAIADVAVMSNGIIAGIMICCMISTAAVARVS